MRSPEKTIEEIEHLMEKYKVKSVYFMDDTFWANPKWAEEVCNLIIDKKINEKIYLMAQTNISTLNENRIKLMHEANFIYLGMGVESGNPHILNDVLCKTHSPENAKKMFDCCRKYNIVTSANFIIGNPDDTKETIADSIKLMESLNPDVKDIHYMTPTPGSHLYNLCLEQGLLQYKGWEDPNRYTPDLLKLKNLTIGDLEKLKNEMEVAYLKHKNLFSAKKLWFKYLLNILLATKNLKIVSRTFILQFLSMNSLFFYYSVKYLLLFRKKIRGY